MEIISRKYTLLFIALLAGFAYFLNEYNTTFIRNINPNNEFASSESLVYNSTINSIDNIWYVSQIKNWVQGKGFTIDPNDEKSMVRRTPIYPIFYGIHYVLLGEEGSFYFIRFTQIILFILATFALLYGVYYFTENKIIAILSAISFGFNPIFISYLYYTITEGISPALVCFLIYFLARCYKFGQKKDWIFAGLFFAIATLCRPAIIFIAPGIAVLVLYKNKASVQQFILSSSLVVIGAAVLYVPHVVRNYMHANEFILLEKYYGDPMDYGMPNIALRKWIACWTNPADLSSESISNRMRLDIVADVDSLYKSVSVENQLDRLPNRAFAADNKATVRAAFSCLYDYYYVKLITKNQTELDSIEKLCLAKITSLKTNYIQKQPLQYYFVTPLLFIKSILFQSNSSTLIFVGANQTNQWLSIMVKGMLLLLNVYWWIALFGLLFFFRKYSVLLSITILNIIGLFFYTIVIQKYFEVRYMIPIYPLMIIISVIFFIEVYGIARKKLNF